MGERRINIRVEDKLFDELDDKRHSQRTTFQEVGLTLLQRWLAGEIPDEKDEQKMKPGTKAALSSGKFGTPNQPDDPIDRKIVQKSTGQGTGPGGQETDHLTEIKSGERFSTSVPPGQTDSARVAAAFEEVNRALADVRALMGRVAESLARSEKTTKPANRAKRVVPPRKGKHPPRFESGA